MLLGVFSCPIPIEMAIPTSIDSHLVQRPHFVQRRQLRPKTEESIHTKENHFVQKQKKIVFKFFDYKCVRFFKIYNLQMQTNISKQKFRKNDTYPLILCDLQLFNCIEICPVKTREGILNVILSLTHGYLYFQFFVKFTVVAIVPIKSIKYLS